MKLVKYNLPVIVSDIRRRWLLPRVLRVSVDLDLRSQHPQVRLRPARGRASLLKNRIY
jgi:hypothetical protein